MDQTISSPASGSGSLASLNLPYQEGDVILGKEKQNPYTPELMAQAYQSIMRKNIASHYNVNIRRTHLYVKFKPQTWDEYNDLKEDSTLQLSDVPLNYQITQNGNSYHDPAINDSLPTFQYAAVRMNYIFNDTIQHELLSYLYIPEQDTSLLGANDENKVFVDKLLDEAYIMTGNFEDTLRTVSTCNCTTNGPYVPGGNIKIFDTRLNTTYGLEGIKVSARRWFTVWNAFTDFNGNYRMFFDYKRPSNYSIWFEHGRFLVKSSGVHWINGPKQTGDWNYTIMNGFDRFAGHIFRAAYRYHYKDIEGLQRPFRWLGRKTAYIAKDAYKSWSGTNPIIFNDIKIARWKNSETEYLSDEVFSTTCHETAHTSHAIKMNTVIQFWQVGAQLRESWAVGIEWALTHKEYTDRGIANYGDANYHPYNINVNPPVLPPQYPNSYAYQYWDKNIDGNVYTNLFINLIDNYNDRIAWFTSGVANDNVSGYTISFIENNIIQHTYGLASLSQNLKIFKPAGVTDAQIDQLLNFY